RDAGAELEPAGERVGQLDRVGLEAGLAVDVNHRHKRLNDPCVHLALRLGVAEGWPCPRAKASDFARGPPGQPASATRSDSMSRSCGLGRNTGVSSISCIDGNRSISVLSATSSSSRASAAPRQTWAPRPNTSVEDSGRWRSNTSGSGYALGSRAV